MLYQTFKSHPDLESIIDCYWTLEVPAEDHPQKQRIIPDGSIEMAFILGEDIKRYTNDKDYILQPRSMVLGQTIAPFYIEPVGYVNTFAIRFYPFGFANFVNVPIESLVNKETPLEELFEYNAAKTLEENITQATDTAERIRIIEQFLLKIFQHKSTVDKLVKSTVDTLFSTNGNASIGNILQENKFQRRQLERNFKKQVGISPKQLGKLIRLQTALKLLLNQKNEKLTHIAYKSEYYDQSHFIKDFKAFTGVTPKDFLGNDNMRLSSVFYQ